jgi:hypothetical protein
MTKRSKKSRINNGQQGDFGGKHEMGASVSDNLSRSN